MRKEIKHKILHSVSRIHENDWKDAFGNIPEGHHFYKTLEESGLKEFSFYYIILYRGKTTLLMAPIFIADLNLEIIIEGWPRNAINYIRKFFPSFFVVKTLFCGSPFGENGQLGFNLGSDTDAVLIMRKLTKTMLRFGKKKKVHLITFKDFRKKDTPALDHTKRHGFFRIESLPSIMVDLDYKSIDEYMASLSHARRKDLRRKLKKTAQGADIKIKTADEVEDIIDDVYALYLNTYLAGRIKFEKLTKDFFINVAKNMHPHTKFFLYYVDGKLAAFNLCFVYKDLFIDKFIGFDYDISYKHNLYFVSWCHNVEYCIEHGIKSFQVGQTDPGPKAQLGGRPINLYAYAKHRNPAYNLLLKCLAKLLRL